jgi:glyoxylase-like metal-dependent hydrolase (beta-lactamase superfamily II)
MDVTVLPVTRFSQNCSILACKASGAAAIVDPGGDLDQIVAQLQAQNLTAQKILLTHGHVDHCAGAPELARRLSIPIEGPHEADRFWIETLPEVASQYGFPPAQVFAPDRWLTDGDTVCFGRQQLQVFHCPGHTPGHVVFFHAAQRMAFVGDVLFAGSIGRTDFPRGDHAQLLASIRDKLWPLGSEVRFVPGHGPDSTFGRERLANPFVGDALLETSSRSGAAAPRAGKGRHL